MGAVSEMEYIFNIHIEGPGDSTAVQRAHAMKGDLSLISGATQYPLPSWKT